MFPLFRTVQCVLQSFHYFPLQMNRESLWTIAVLSTLHVCRVIAFIQEKTKINIYIFFFKRNKLKISVIGETSLLVGIKKKRSFFVSRYIIITFLSDFFNSFLFFKKEKYPLFSQQSSRVPKNRFTVKCRCNLNTLNCYNIH